MKTASEARALRRETAEAIGSRFPVDLASLHGNANLVEEIQAALATHSDQAYAEGFQDAKVQSIQVCTAEMKRGLTGEDLVERALGVTILKIQSLQVPSPSEPLFRCFHCDAILYTVEEAREHLHCSPKNRVGEPS